jgi:hypothetical protein
MTSRVFQLHSTLELPLEDVYEYFDDPDLPVEIADIDITRRNNTLIVSAVAAEDNISKYTPTAQLKASVSENRVYEHEDGEWREEPPEPEHGFGSSSSSSSGSSSSSSSSGPQWGAFGEQEEEEAPNSKLVEYACFKGDRETVLQNTALQYPMFEVLCGVARTADKGALTAIAAVDDELEAVRIVEGEDRVAQIKVVEDPTEKDNCSVNWRDNKFISS